MFQKPIIRNQKCILSLSNNEMGLALGIVQKSYAMEPKDWYGSKLDGKVLKNDKDVWEWWKPFGQMIHVQFEPQEPLLGTVWDFLSLELAWCANN